MRDPTALMLPVTTVAIRYEVVLLEKVTIFETCWLSLPYLALPFLAKTHRHTPPRSEPFTSEELPSSRSPRPGPLLGLGVEGVRGTGGKLPAPSRRRRLQRGAVTGGRSWCDTTARLPGAEGRKR